MKTIFDELQQEVKNWWISLILGILYVIVAISLMFVHIVTSEKEYEYRGKLKDVADVTEEYFLLIHKSYLINMEHVEHYEYDNVVMKDKTRLSISKANRKKVRERLLQTEKKRL